MKLDKATTKLVSDNSVPRTTKVAWTKTEKSQVKTIGDCVHAQYANLRRVLLDTLTHAFETAE